MSAVAENDVLDAGQMLDLLRVSRAGLYSLLRQRKIPAGAKIGKKRLWLRRDVVEFLHRKGGSK